MSGTTTIPYRAGRPERGIDVPILNSGFVAGTSGPFVAGLVSYHLSKFPPRNLEWSRLIPLIGPTSAGLARYDGFLQAIPNASVLHSPMTTQEAILSSRIEGTYATMGEVLEYDAAGRGRSSGYTSPRKDGYWRLHTRNTASLLSTSFSRPLSLIPEHSSMGRTSRHRRHAAFSISLSARLC